jgi:hypothetical protein
MAMGAGRFKENGKTIHCTKFFRKFDWRKIDEEGLLCLWRIISYICCASKSGTHLCYLIKKLVIVVVCTQKMIRHFTVKKYIYEIVKSSNMLLPG